MQESKWTEIQNTATKKTLQLGQIKMATLNLFQLATKQMKLQVDVPLEDTETQLGTVRVAAPRPLFFTAFGFPQPCALEAGEKPTANAADPPVHHLPLGEAGTGVASTRVLLPPVPLLGQTRPRVAVSSSVPQATTGSGPYCLLQQPLLGLLL